MVFCNGGRHPYFGTSGQMVGRYEYCPPRRCGNAGPPEGARLMLRRRRQPQAAFLRGRRMHPAYHVTTLYTHGNRRVWRERYAPECYDHHERFFMARGWPMRYPDRGENG